MFKTIYTVAAMLLLVTVASAQQKTTKAALNGSKYTPFRMAQGTTANNYRAGSLLVKVKPEYAAACERSNITEKTLQNALIAIGANDIKKAFPNDAPPAAKTNAQGQEMADLSTIYRLQYATSRMTIETAANTLLKTGMVAYAEPDYIYQVDAFTPNDPSFATQTFLSRINATNAWDLAQGGSQGDTTTIIAIVDSGMDTDHPDLASQYKINYADPINGIDDDNDGYIDNRVGWDLAGADFNTVVGDNNPNTTAANNAHGVHVSGCASAATNNGVGVSGIGFKCKLLAVKCSADNDTRGSGGAGYVIAGYDGIKYAADHGAHIINCSWGGAGGGQFGQDIITYATINKNALVIAAAGNDGSEIAFFPASYTYVLSVAATNSTNDQRASFTNYGYTVDISTPGNGIYATDFNNAYASQSGTSMASPITAGAGGLVRSKFPNLNALQIGERLRATSDNHYGVAQNATATYKNKLGKGRLNAFRALTINTPSIRITPLAITDNGDEAWIAGETLDLRATFNNYLDPTTNMVCTLAPVNATTFITVLAANASYTIPSLGTLASITNTNAPFKILINAAAPANAKIPMKITMTSGTYTDTHFFDMIVNVDYINVRVNQVGTTITSKGRTGYNGTGQLEGVGFVYRDSSILYEMGFLAGTSPTQVSDNIRGASGTYNDHWKSSSRILVKQNNLCSEKDLFGRFNDTGNTTAPLGANVDHKFYAWSTPGDDKYVIVRYVFHNNGTADWNNMYVGMFADWDITGTSFGKNKIGENAATKMGYAYCTNPNGIYGGIKVVSNTPFKHYGLDNIAPPAGVISIIDADGYSTADKYNTMANSNPTAGTQSAAGNDVLDIVSTGPFNVAVGDSITIAYALIGGDNLADLIASANAAQLKYDNVIVPCETTTPVATDNTNALIATMTAQPNPTADFTQIKINMVETANITLNLTDLTGKQIRGIYTGAAQQGNNTFDLNTADLANGTYIYTLQTGGKTMSQRIVVLK